MKKLTSILALALLSTNLLAFDICGRCVQNCVDNGQSKANCVAFNCASQCNGVAPKSTVDASCFDYYTRVEGMSAADAEEYCKTDYDPETEFDINDII